jgi:asparagine synthase (glutamine-hydrolysing)
MGPRLKDALEHRHVMSHPLYQGPVDSPPGKVLQSAISMLAASVNYNPRSPHEYPVAVAPLCAQPFTELSLRIPTYVLTAGGRDRAIARQAFAADIPAEISLRKTKGGQAEHVKALLFHNRALIRELLLGGFLAQERYLDQGVLDEALSRQPNRLQTWVMQIFAYLDVEVWARSIHSAREKRAAA